MAVHAPVQAVPTMALVDSKIPILALTDALEAEGFVGVNRLCRHDRSSAMEFDQRNVISKRSYLQAALALPNLLVKGVTGFRSGLAISYYQVLLKAGADVEQGLKSKDYRRRLAELMGDGVTLASLLSQPVAPKPRLALQQDGGNSSIAGDDVAALGDIGGDDEQVGAIPPPDEPRLEDAAADVGGDEVAEGAWSLAEFPDHFLGQRLMKTRAKKDSKWSYCARVAVCCSNPLHSCTRSRSIEMLVGELGPKAALCYLGCWLDKAHLTQAEHRAYQPTQDEMHAFRLLHKL